MVSHEFWIGFGYGACAAAIPLLGFIAWDANRRVQEYLRGSTVPPGVQQPHPPHRTCPCAECRAYPWKDEDGVPGNQQ
jgi:hypothetical protein